MRLYTTGSRWAGTQADAKKLGKFVQVDVPTDKQGLLDWLNKMHWHAPEAVAPIQEPPAPTRQPSEPAKPREIKQNSWDEFNTVKKHLETCNREAVFTIMNLAIQRYYELDGVED
jgi:hypothetical protein